MSQAKSSRRAEAVARAKIPATIARVPGESSDEGTHQIGTRLKSLREQDRLSIRALSRRAGVSASLISETERGLVEPSVGVLQRLATALDVRIPYFFSRGGSAGEVVIRRDARLILKEEAGARYELLGSDTTRSFEPFNARLSAFAGLEDPTVQHEGQEWLMVLRG